jgi:hypothetical protein
VVIKVFVISGSPISSATADATDMDGLKALKRFGEAFQTQTPKSFSAYADCFVSSLGQQGLEKYQ